MSHSGTELGPDSNPHSTTNLYMYLGLVDAVHAVMVTINLPMAHKCPPLRSFVLPMSSPDLKSRCPLVPFFREDKFEKMTVLGGKYRYLMPKIGESLDKVRKIGKFMNST
jgi:hypothetical protein